MHSERQVSVVEGMFDLSRTTDVVTGGSHERDCAINALTINACTVVACAINARTVSACAINACTVNARTVSACAINARTINARHPNARDIHYCDIGNRHVDGRCSGCSRCRTPHRRPLP